MKLFLAAMPILVSTLSVATPCQPPNRPNGTPYSMEDDGLAWSASDTGFNEGASCGLAALTGTGVAGLPAVAAQPVLGNTWRRRDMIALAKTAAKNGAEKQAVDAAICSQIQNGHMHTCMESHRAEVLTWLKR